MKIERKTDLPTWWYFGTKKTKCFIDPKLIDLHIPEYIRQTYDWGVTLTND